VLRELYGFTSAAAFGPLAMRSVQRHCTQADMARIYVDDICAEIRRVFKWATTHEMLSPTIYQARTTVPGLKQERSQARDNAPVIAVDEATVAATLLFQPPVILNMVRFHILVGCRPSEVCILRPCDVDTKGEAWTYAPVEQKAQHFGRARRIIIGPKAQDGTTGLVGRLSPFGKARKSRPCLGKSINLSVTRPTAVLVRAGWPHIAGGGPGRRFGKSVLRRFRLPVGV
jgi:hypothetical protein